MAKSSREADFSMMQVPIMLRSTYCCLNDRSDKELTEYGECPYDQVSLTKRDSVLILGEIIRRVHRVLWSRHLEYWHFPILICQCTCIRVE